MKHLFLTLSVCLLAVANISAQQRVINGHVYAFKDLCLKNIKVEAKKSGAKVTTDSLGNFTIVCEKKDRIIFTGMGFEGHIKNIKKEDNLNVKMVFEGGVNNEEIAVGYGHVSQEELTHAVAHLSKYNNNFSNYTDVFQLIQGNFSGVQVVNVNGQKKILVRGMSSTTASNYAIYVVDGVKVNDISHIVPSWIESIDVLKDGGGAIYGAQGGTGVVLITTTKS